MPYPNWEANTIESDGAGSSETVKGRADAKKAEVVDGALADNSSIISTFRIRVDECDRLWVIRSGLLVRVYNFCFSHKSNKLFKSWFKYILDR